MNNIEVVDQDKSLISQIRLPRDAFDISKTAMNFGLEIILRFVEYLVPKKTQEVRDWYSKEIEPLKSGVLRKNRIIVK